MNNILIFTVGARDVQLKREILTVLEFEAIQVEEPVPEKTGRTKKTNYIQWKGTPVRIAYYIDPNFPDTLMLSEPRNAGEELFRQYELFQDYLHYPMLEATLHWFQENKEVIHEIWWVVTDQILPDAEATDSIQYDRMKANQSRDTLNFAAVMHKYLQHQNLLGQEESILMKEITFRSHVAKLDKAYEQLHAVRKVPHFQEGFDPEKSQIFLMLQGGIDAINTAVLLRFTEWNPRCIQFQLEESSTTLRTVGFPGIIRRNLEKRIIIQLAQQQEFHMLALTAEDSTITYVARFMARIQDYDWPGIQKQLTTINQTQLWNTTSGTGKQLKKSLLTLKQENYSTVSPKHLKTRLNLLVQIVFLYLKRFRPTETLIRLDIVREFIRISFVDALLFTQFQPANWQRKDYLIGNLKKSDNHAIAKWVIEKYKTTQVEYNDKLIDYLIQGLERHQYSTRNGYLNQHLATLTQLDKKIGALKKYRNSFLHLAMGIPLDQSNQILEKFEEISTLLNELDGIQQDDESLFSLAEQYIIELVELESENKL